MNILLTGPNFHDMNHMIAEAFSALGCEIKISTWPNLNGNIIDNSRLLFHEKINRTIDPSEIIYNIFKTEIVDYNKKLLQEISTIRPDLMMVLKGDILLPETIKEIRDKTDIILVLWCYDSALRFKNVLDGGKYYHLVYSYEPTDIQVLKKYSIDAKYLPMAYDPNKYFKCDGEPIIRDISFVGLIKNYPDRKKILENIIFENRKIKLEVWGQTWGKLNPFLLYEYKIKRRLLSEKIHNYNIHPEEVNKIYNSSRICLNIHHPQSKEGMNPRTFEILGAGGFQLVDYKKTIEEFFTIGKEIVCYENENDLLNKIEYYLENEGERKRIAQRGHDLVKKKHTYKHRAETILTDVEKIRG